MARALFTVTLANEGTPNQLAIAHIHHDVRGTDADKDQSFVESFGNALGVEVCVRRLDGKLLQSNRRDGFEAAARTARYAALVEIAHERGCRYLVTGHNMDDQAETVLFRVLRGSGVMGLAAIRRQRRIDDGLTLVRPLLGMTRADIDAYLAAIEQSSCVDRSNFDPDLATRNWIRHELMPQICARMGGHVSQSLAQLAQTADEHRCFIDAWVEPMLEQAVTVDADRGLILDCRVLRELPVPLIHAALQKIWWQKGWPQQAMTNEKWRLLTGMATDSTPEAPVAVFPGSIRARRAGDKLHLEPQNG